VPSPNVGPTSCLTGERRVVLLADFIGNRVVPIWVGNFEGDAIAILLVGAEARRPLTWPFAARVLEAAGGKLAEVRINRLVDETFYAQAVVASSTGSQTVDARPSDAIALALETEAPIRMAASIVSEAGVGRADLDERTGNESRSAREHADEVRSLVAESKWIRPTVF
jgi:bifunctional DNase/RNase